MASFVLKKPGLSGDELPLIGTNPLRGIEENSQQRVSLLTDDNLSLSLTSNAPLDLPVNSSVEAFGQLYSLNRDAQVRKLGESRFEYDLSLDGPQYHLLRVVFFDPDISGNTLSPNVTLTGNLAAFAQMLELNFIRVFSGAWRMGDVKAPSLTDLGQTIDGGDTEVKTLTFENTNCLDVLQRICAEWGTEFWIEYRPNDAPNRILHIEPLDKVNPYFSGFSFQYGQGKGLYEFTRKSKSDVAFYNRVYFYGGTRNLPTNYRGFAKYLQLPQTSGLPNVPVSPWDSKLDDNASIAANGLIEGTKYFDEIYPSRTGAVGGSASQLSFVDVTLDFDINKYLAPGLKAKVHFQTGDLAGYEFEIASFVLATGTFTLNPYTDSSNNVFPSPDPASPFRIKTGDNYVLLDILLPDEYVTAAEARLLAAAQAWLEENAQPSVEYSLTIDPLYLKSQAHDTGQLALDNPPNFFTVGDKLRIVDASLGIDKFLRVNGFTRSVTNPYQYTLTLGDARKLSRLQQLLKQKAVVVPVQVPTPQQTPTKVEVKNQIFPFGHNQNYTLFAGLLPLDGFTNIIFPNHSRQKPFMDVKRKTLQTTPIDEVIGTLLAHGAKRKIR